MSDILTNYIDGFVFPVPKMYLHEYNEVAVKVAEIWKEYGALAYHEYVGEDLKLDGTRSFIAAVEAKEDEVIVFGWVAFPSKAIRNLANKQVPNDPRIADLIKPLIDPNKVIFDATRMVYGGFQSLVTSHQ